MDIEVFPSPRLMGKIRAPPSKSYTHRAVIMGALADGTSIIKEPLIGQDTIASIQAMRALGAEILEERDRLIIRGIKQFQIPDKTIDVENSGSTIRFITALTAHVPGTVKLTGDASIQKRPMGPLLDALTQLGIECQSEHNDGTPPLIVKGKKLKGGHVSIPGNISSQFISGLLISSPLAQSDVTIQLTTPLKSTPYLAITSDMLNKFGIKHQYDSTQRIYKIPGSQTYHPIEFTIPGDFSSASFFLTAGAILDGSISVSNLDKEDPQGDKQILEILKAIGANITINHKEKIVTVNKDALNPFEIDCSDIPDLVPILAVLASFIPKQSKLFNAAHLRIKESDRLHTITTELQKMKVDIKELPDALIINGSSRHKGAVLESYNDHRIAMALIIASLPLEEKTLIKNIECINVSYPSFLEDLKKLGGKFQLINNE
ncbi:MAG: 3-phosphoshikimate 1-carboxyvinyltransferase [Candidatus Helarchaeota archaeon]|nr:3-phosphoshikimate 1-carboxyvinyltransferase [Candidatus Helarchaeota archaeon]